MGHETHKAVVMGAGGFAGGELLRLLVGHPGLELAAALSTTHAGKRVGDVHAGLEACTDLSFTDSEEWSWDRVRGESWVLFSALPHGRTMKALPPILDGLKGNGLKVVDLSGDFRLDEGSFETYYGIPHVEPGYLDRFVYGLPELNAGRIARADYVANPGCFATGAQLAILPVAGSGAKVRCVAISGMTGSSGAGSSPGAATHHPNRMNNFSAYGQLVHRQLPEITGGWAAAGGDTDVDVSFVPHRAPMVRGIFTTAHVFLEEAAPSGDVFDWYASWYVDAPFVRIVDGSASVADVWGTNRCDISITVEGRTIAVCTAIDNLVKGAAGQAVQNANILCGWDETAGLVMPVPSPV